jgi:hypothetical protein
MTALLWFHAIDDRHIAKDNVQLEGTACTGGVTAVPGERDVFECLSHGQLVYYMQRPRTEDFAVGAFAPPEMQAELQEDERRARLQLLAARTAETFTSSDVMRARDQHKVDRYTFMMEQYGSAWKQVLDLAYSEQIKFQKTDPQTNAMSAMNAVVDDLAELRQVGWYCAGGHDIPSKRSPGNTVKAKPSLRMRDKPQCSYAEPVFVLVAGARHHEVPVPAPDYSNDHPDPDWVANQVETLVRVGTHSGVEYVGLLSIYVMGNPTINKSSRYIELENIVGAAADSPPLRLLWDDVHSVEPLL